MIEPKQVDFSGADGDNWCNRGGIWTPRSTANLRRDFFVSDYQTSTTRPVARSDGGTLVDGDRWFDPLNGWDWVYNDATTSWLSARFRTQLYTGIYNHSISARTINSAARSLTTVVNQLISNDTAYDMVVRRIYGKAFITIANSATRFLTLRFSTRNLSNTTVSTFGTTVNSQAITVASWWAINLPINTRYSVISSPIFSTDFLVTEPLETVAFAAWNVLPTLTMEYQFLR